MRIVPVNPATLKTQEDWRRFNERRKKNIAKRIKEGKMNAQSYENFNRALEAAIKKMEGIYI